MGRSVHDLRPVQAGLNYASAPDVINSPAALRPLYALARAQRDRNPQLAVRLCRFIVDRTANQASVSADRLRAVAAVTQGVALASLGDIAGSLTINAYVIEAFRQSTDVDIRTSVCWAMVNKGWDLVLQDRLEEAISVYDDFSNSVPFEPPFVHPVAQGLMNWAMAFERTGRHLEEMAIYDRIARALGSPTTEAELCLLAWCYINKAITLTASKEYSEAIELCDVVLSRWWNLSDWNTSTKVREFLAAAIRHRANAMAGRGEYQLAIAEVDRLLKRYMWSNETGLSMEVALAMLTKAASLELLGFHKESKDTHHALVTRFSRSRDQQVQAAVETARGHRERVA
jgi:tetratricopeptide (TPR) repeat protein